MPRRYRSAGKGGITTDRSEARANRRLQLVHSSTHHVEPGMTLIQKMEVKLDDTLKTREVMIKTRDAAVEAEEAHPGKAFWSDELEDKYLDDMLRNEGKVQGMLVMLGIMRSTNMKTELTRAKARIKYNG
jgi:hypothetical protein